MAKNKLELGNLTDAELQQELATAQKHYDAMEFTHNVTPMSNTGELVIARRTVARIYTEIRKRELGTATEQELGKRSKLRARRKREKKS
jgi:large subunit ribosomal protein L29